MEVERRSDDQNVYLTSGGDNLALHQASTDHRARRVGAAPRSHRFFVSAASDVDAWSAWLTSQRSADAHRTAHTIAMAQLLLLRPDGTHLQIIHHPPVNAWGGSARHRPTAVVRRVMR